jgi:hypothetical protein
MINQREAANFSQEIAVLQVIDGASAPALVISRNDPGMFGTPLASACWCASIIDGLEHEGCCQTMFVDSQVNHRGRFWRSVERVRASGDRLTGLE